MVHSGSEGGVGLAANCNKENQLAKELLRLPVVSASAEFLVMGYLMRRNTAGRCVAPSDAPWVMGERETRSPAKACRGCAAGPRGPPSLRAGFLGEQAEDLCERRQHGVVCVQATGAVDPLQHVPQSVGRGQRLLGRQWVS